MIRTAAKTSGQATRYVVASAMKTAAEPSAQRGSTHAEQGEVGRAAWHRRAIGPTSGAWPALFV